MDCIYDRQSMDVDTAYLSYKPNNQFLSQGSLQYRLPTVLLEELIS